MLQRALSFPLALAILVTVAADITCVVDTGLYGDGTASCYGALAVTLTLLP